MSERILRALMQLFAIIAKIDEVHEGEGENEDGTQVIQSTKGKQIITGFLKAELSSSDVDKYLNIFDNFLVATHGQAIAKNKDQKRTSLHSVKILRICSQINKELTQRQKIIVLIRMFEFIDRDDHRTDKETKFVQTVSESFHVEEREYEMLRNFVELGGKDVVDETDHVYYADKELGPFTNAKSEVVDGLDAVIHFVYVKSVRTLFFKYFGEEELYINGQIVDSDKTHVFNVGSTVRTGKISQIFYSDLISKLTNSENIAPLSFEMKNVIHKFKGGGSALRKISLSTTTGKMIGVMGGSGAGKTSLLNIMNGKMKPTFGSIEINGINLHEEKHRLEGVIGNVNQNDLLIEELTVFENLYYSAKLCLRGLSQKHLTVKVNRLLTSLGLFDIKDLKVGSSIDKVISGGQRKRLNIALELIREPSVLFVDEPTSGLSSRDSDNIMDLLKELSLKGKLIFVVIHQPSSNIFKLFDRLLILDQGGYPIYDGIPLNAIVYFKTFSYKGNAHERECNLCGNVNPEQIFNLIDAKIVDEFGNESTVRKKTPEDWNELYKKHKQEYKVTTASEAPDASVKLPTRLSQFFSYLTRDFLSKKSNSQYMLINGLVAPVLALILSFFIKYFGFTEDTELYSFFYNENIPQYIFIAVIVSIFLGLTVSAEEINKDKKILAREEFINLSRSSFLMSKISILFFISAVQSFMFILIGNYILEIKGMWLEYWLILFSTACLSNLMGLNISSAFNSAKVIYIIIPLLIIPQLLFSGVIVKFDKLHPTLSNATKVPWVGNIMVSRWAYEGLAVEQASQNKFENYLLDYKIPKSEAEWKKDYWLPEVKKQMNTLLQPNISNELQEKTVKLLTIELGKEDEKWHGLECENCLKDLRTKSMSNEEDFQEIDKFLNFVRLQYVNTVNKNADSIQQVISRLGVKKYKKLQAAYSNEALSKVVTNKAETKKFIISNNEIYQNDNPIYNIPTSSSFFDSHYYTPYKKLFGITMSTYQANMVIIWLLSILTYILLYFDVLKKFLTMNQRIFDWFKTKEE